MKNFKRGRIRDKFILVFILIIVLFNTIMPTYSKAAFDWGGALWTPIQELVCGIGDVIFNLFQKSFIANAPDAVFKATMSQIEEGKTYNWLWARITSIGPGFSKELDYKRAEIVFPSIYYSVENIFANKIPAFDVNFINPSVKNPEPSNNGDDVQQRTEDLEYAKEIENIYYDFDKRGEEDKEKVRNFENNIRNKISEIKSKYEKTNESELSEQAKKEKQWAENAEELINVDQYIDGTVITGVIKEYRKIVSSAYDAGVSLGNLKAEEGNKAIGNIAKDLQPTIAKWYNALKNLALVAMLSILVYTGIRITLGSTSQEQAKYKIMLKDWLLAICILFIMHYIMALALSVTETLTNMLYETYSSAMKEQENIVEQELSEQGTNSYLEQLLSSSAFKDITADTLATTIRLRVSIASDTGEAMGYTIMYAVFVIYTIIFTWQYLKRVVYMAFLTMIAPLVAMTYPIDKMRDGSAQGFNMWLKEYVFNLLLQPLHLLLFTILVVSALDLAKTSVIYSLIALGFMLEAVKIVKSFFGLDKAPLSGGGFASGFAGGAVFSAGLGALKKITSLGKPGPKNSGGKSSGEDKKINFAAGSERGSDLKGLSAFSSAKNTPGATNSEGAGNKKSKTKTKYKGTLAKNATKKAPKGRSSLGDKNLFATAKAARASRKNGRRKITGVAKGIGKVGKGVAAVGWKGAKRFVPAAAKYAVAGLGAATLGTIGIAAGLASDDIEDVAKYGLAGVAGGFAVGKSAASSVGNLVSNVKNGAGGIADTFKQGYYGEDYETEKANSEWRKSKDVNNHLKNLYGSEWKIAKEGQQYMREEAGITDQKDLDKATKLLKNNKDISMKEIASVMKFKDATDRSELRDPSKRQAIQNKVDKLVQDQGKRDKVMNLLDQIHDV